jgi:hypothetical protein
MAGEIFSEKTKQLLDRLERDNSRAADETYQVSAVGDEVTAWPAKIISHKEFNTYNVSPVEIIAPGVNPVQRGSEITAFNLAESFIGTGSLTPGSYVVVFRVGSKNVFYLEP